MTTGLTEWAYPLAEKLLAEPLPRRWAHCQGVAERARRGGRLTSNEYSEVWSGARKAVLSEQELRTALAEVPYSLRHAAISLWIKSGMDPVEAAYRAGHSLAVLYRFYAKLLKGGSAAAN